MQITPGQRHLPSEKRRKPAKSVTLTYIMQGLNELSFVRTSVFDGIANLCLFIYHHHTTFISFFYNQAAYQMHPKIYKLSLL